MEFKSDLSGDKRALLVGISYPGTDAPLHGSQNDVRNISSLLQDVYGFKEDKIVILKDTDNDNMPTKARILREMRLLVESGKPNDSLFFYYSGHGDERRDRNKDEWDRYDEYILPCDEPTAGGILDDEIYDTLVKKLPPKCRLTAIMDCCCSGTILDLPFEYNEHGHLLIPNPPSKIGAYINFLVFALSKSDRRKNPFGNAKADPFEEHQTMCSGSSGPYVGNPITAEKKKLQQDVVLLSACRDFQTSNQSGSSGAFTKELVQLIREKIHVKNNAKEAAYTDLIAKMLPHMQKYGFKQQPRLSSAYPLSSRDLFMI